MSGPEAKNPAPAGTSSQEEIDVAALFERLRTELRRGAPGDLPWELGRRSPAALRADMQALVDAILARAKTP
jgi:hypothetical protein